MTDTGVGVPHDRLDRLFQTIFAGRCIDDTPIWRHRPWPCDLRQLAGLMGGTIGVESQPGSGSTFWFTSRFRRNSEPAAIEPRLSPSSPSVDKASLRLLLAEDNPINQLVAVGLLEMLGYACDVVDDGRAAIEAIESGNYDLVLMDCPMPVLDGFAATREIRRTEKDKNAQSAGFRIPIIALTANAMKGDRERCLESGMDDYLAKPIEPESLAQTIDRYLLENRSGFAESNGLNTSDVSTPGWPRRRRAKSSGESIAASTRGFCGSMSISARAAASRSLPDAVRRLINAGTAGEASGPIRPSATPRLPVRRPVCAPPGKSTVPPRPASRLRRRRAGSRPAHEFPPLETAVPR